MLAQIPAELKLVVAGNHDLDLDGKYLDSHYDAEIDDPDDHIDAVAVMTCPLAKAAGVTYLAEGMHSFTLSNGTTFKIDASPYQPAFGDWAFMYERYQDRYNGFGDEAEDAVSIAEHSIPSCEDGGGGGGVDIVMMYGPPMFVLDECRDGHVGCANLLRAVARARSLLHCFGHIHRGNMGLRL